MADPTVLLRLSGRGSPDRLRAWVEALGRVPAGPRSLHLADPSAAHPGLAEWCRLADVALVGSSRPADVLVLASAADLPAPRALQRLVAATAGSGRAHESRVLPFAATSAAPDAEPSPVPVLCVALPAAVPDLPDAVGAGEAVALLRASGSDVRRLVSAAVFSDRRPDATPAPTAPDLAGPPPYGHPAALPSTSLHQLLLRTGLTPPELPQDREERPMLTVLTRTQGTRLQCLEETLTCLAGQSSRDFEVVLACHRVAPEALGAVRALVAEMPEWLRARTRVLEIDRPGRSAPLNDALDLARGRYAVMLDDDDAVTADWVAAFAEAEAKAPGTVLRSVALAQEVRPETVDATAGPAPVEVGPAHRVWPARFSLVDHLHDNESPPMTFAVPRGVFADLGHRFNEALDTTEDWEFLVRAAGVTGVTSTLAVTAVYRVWTDSEGSRHLHDADHWAAGRSAVLETIDREIAILPPGAAQDVRDLRQALLDERAEKFRFAGLNEQAARDLVTVNEAVVALRGRIAELEERIARMRRKRQMG